MRPLHLIRPDALIRREPLFWYPDVFGSDLWDLVAAAATGDVTTAAQMLDRNPALARASFSYRSALSFAVRYNHPAVVRLLIERGANPMISGTPDSLLQIARDRGYTEIADVIERAVTREGRATGPATAIADAIVRRDAAEVRRLLDTSPDLVHAIDSRSNQPIHWAVMTRQVDLVDDLLTRGADIDAQRIDGARPIHLTNGDYHYRGWRDVPAIVTTTPDDVYRHLLARGADVDIWMASVKGDLARVRALLDADPSLVNRLSPYGSYYAGAGSAIQNAAAGGHIEIVRLLLERGADPNLPEPGIAPEGRALYSAVYNGHYDIALLLLERGARPNVEVESSADTLTIAQMRGDQRMVELLCSYGAARRLHLLAHSNDVETAAAVFAANADAANDPDAFANAATQGHTSFVRLMLRYRPDLPTQISTGTPQRELTELLLAHGMDPNRREWPNVTPLHRFAEDADVENAAIFIAHGANIDAVDEEFETTPLGYAARFGRALMAAFLLRNGASLRPTGVAEWSTPIAWATRRGHQRVVDLLDRYDRDGSLPSAPDAVQIEALAMDLLAAYNGGDHDALRRFTDYVQPPRTELNQVRRHVRLRLGLPRDVQVDITIDQARELVRRMLGIYSPPDVP